MFFDQVFDKFVRVCYQFTTFQVADKVLQFRHVKLEATGLRQVCY